LVALLTISHILYDKANGMVILAISFVFSLILASLSYFFVEKPSIQYGRKIADLVDNKRNVKIKDEQLAS
jgi:peptidoglycan/LPS O-acetylase OafA/YrhL